MALSTAEEHELEFAETGLHEDEEAELKTWLVVGAVCEPDFVTEINFGKAFDLLNDHYQGAARLLTDTMDNLCLLIDPTSEAVTMGSALATDLAYGVWLDPDLVERALTERIDDIWDSADLPDRIDWLVRTELSLEHAFDDDCPEGLIRFIAHDYNLI